MNKIKMFMPTSRLQSNLAIAFSIFALFFAVGSSNVPCLSADTCAVGSDETFSGTLSIQNGTNYNLQVTGNPTANRVLTLPDATGTVALTSDIPSTPTLTPSKILSSSALGVVETTDKYPFTLGSIGEFLKVAPSGLTMDFASITGVPTLTATKSVSTDGAGALTTNDVYPLSLTASKVAKTDVSGNLTTGQIDVTTDVIAGTSLQQIRTNAGATGTEWFTPTGSASPIIMVASGSMMQSTTTTTHSSICWYDQVTFDKTKVYELILYGGNGNVGSSGTLPHLFPQSGDCSTGSTTKWDSSLTGVQRNMRMVGRRGDTPTNRASDTSTCEFLQANSNDATNRSSNIGGTFEFRSGSSFSSSVTGKGVMIGVNAYSNMENGSGVSHGIQDAFGHCAWTTVTLDFADITGIFGDFEGGVSPPINGKKWVLYEISEQQ